MSGKHRSDVVEPSLVERLEFLIETWERDMENLATSIEKNEHPENREANRTWLSAKYFALIDLKRVLKEGDW